VDHAKLACRIQKSRGAPPAPAAPAAAAAEEAVAAGGA